MQRGTECQEESKNGTAHAQRPHDLCLLGRTERSDDVSLEETSTCTDAN